MVSFLDSMMNSSTCPHVCLVIGVQADEASQQWTPTEELYTGWWTLEKEALQDWLSFISGVNCFGGTNGTWQSANVRPWNLSKFNFTSSCECFQLSPKSHPAFLMLCCFRCSSANTKFKTLFAIRAFSCIPFRPEYVFPYFVFRVNKKNKRINHLPNTPKQRT